MHPGCKVLGFVQQKLTLQMGSPYIRSLLLTASPFWSTTTFPYIWKDITSLNLTSGMPCIAIGPLSSSVRGTRKNSNKGMNDVKNTYIGSRSVFPFLHSLRLTITTNRLLDYWPRGDSSLLPRRVCSMQTIVLSWERRGEANSDRLHTEQFYSDNLGAIS